MATEREQWDELVNELDLEINFNHQSNYKMGAVLYRMKLHLKKHGLDQVRTGRWEGILRERKIDKSTARDWVVKYQLAENIPWDKCFFEKEVARVAKKRNTLQNRGNNRAVPALFESEARVVAASEVNPKKVDDSEDKRTAVECVFVLTYVERLAFMDAVRKLSELRATQVMYRAVLAAANDKEDAQGVGA